MPVGAVTGSGTACRLTKASTSFTVNHTVVPDGGFEADQDRLSISLVSSLLLILSARVHMTRRTEWPSFA